MYTILFNLESYVMLQSHLKNKIDNQKVCCVDGYYNALIHLLTPDAARTYENCVQIMNLFFNTVNTARSVHTTFM
jgi:hypothetical protein